MLEEEEYVKKGEEGGGTTPHLYLSLHGDAEESDEVHHEDRPEYGDVEQLKEGTDEGDGRGLGGRVPELELGQTSDERPEFLVLARRQPRLSIYTDNSDYRGGNRQGSLTVVSIQFHGGWIDLRSEKGEEEVEVVDGQGVGDDVPALSNQRSPHCTRWRKSTCAMMMRPMKQQTSRTVAIHLLLV